jgi:hypothetical protein
VPSSFEAAGARPTRYRYGAIIGLSGARGKSE